MATDVKQFHGFHFGVHLLFHGVHFGEEKTKSILFGTKRQLKDQRDLNLKYGDIEIKQHSRVTYLGCILDNILSGEHMAAKY